MLPEVLNDPYILTALAAVITLLVYWQRTLSWSEYRTIHSLKRAVLPFVDAHTSLFVVSRKGFRNDGEYVTTVNKPLRETFVKLSNDGFSPHLINSIKLREHPDHGDQYSAAHLVKFHDDKYQSEIYLLMKARKQIFTHTLNGMCSIPKRT